MYTSTKTLAHNITLEYLKTEIARTGTIQLQAGQLAKSMGKLIFPADTLVFIKVEPEKIAVGDIVLFFNGEDLVAHRAIRLYGDFVVTKGDSLDYHDELIKRENCIAKLIKILRGKREISCFSAFQKAPTLDSLFLNSTLPPQLVNGEYSAILYDKLKQKKELISLIYYEGLAPLFFFYNEKVLAEGHILPEISQGLSHFYYDTMARNIVAIRKIKSVLKELAPIKCILLKGVFLADCLYDNPALRPFSDVDILIKPEDTTTVFCKLQKMGFIAEDDNVLTRVSDSEKNNWLNSVCFYDKSSVPITFHIHWHWCNSNRPIYLSVSQNMESVWQRAFMMDAENMFVLSDEHLLIHLCEHAVKHSFARLILLRDIVEVLIKKHNYIDWDFFVEEARSMGFERHAFYSLLYVSKIVPFFIPSSILARLKPHSNSFLSKKFFALAERGIRDPELSNLLYFEMQPDIKAKISFIKRTIFPEIKGRVSENSGGLGENWKGYFMRLRKVLSRLFLIMRGLCFKNAFLFLICFSLFMQSAKASGEDDDWWGEDKQLHFAASFLIDSGGYWVSREGLGLQKKNALALAAFGTAGIGLAKELTDEEFSYRDMAWNVAGITLSSVLWFSLDRRDKADSRIRVNAITAPYFSFVAISTKF